MADQIGAMRERLAVQQNIPAAIAVSSLTLSGVTATAVTSAPHGFISTDYVTIAGAVPAGYNGRRQVTVTGPSSFTFTVPGAPSSPATGTITATYASDAQGGRKAQWNAVATVPAEMMPIGASERLQLAALQSNVTYRFHVRRRSDVAMSMRALWTPSWPPASPQRLLEITGVLIDDADFMLIECTEAQA
jgi:head-tail adaptor